MAVRSFTQLTLIREGTTITAEWAFKNDCRDTNLIYNGTYLNPSPPALPSITNGILTLEKLSAVEIHLDSFNNSRAIEVVFQPGSVYNLVRQLCFHS